MKLYQFLFLICIFLLLSCKGSSDELSGPERSSDLNNTSVAISPYFPTAQFIVSKAEEALAFCKSNNMNQDFCLLIDFGIHSGKKRFFVWDFNKKEIIHQFLVGHGCGDNTWSGDETKDNPTFSNTEDSHRSSLGKYKIGERGYSNWGVHTKYLMHGLEPSNSNALKRIIVFHSWEAVSDEEVYPNGTPEGWGCPTISNASFTNIDPLLKAATKPVLMWIYNGED